MRAWLIGHLNEFGSKIFIKWKEVAPLWAEETVM